MEFGLMTSLLHGFHLAPLLQGFQLVKFSLLFYSTGDFS